MIEPQPNNTQRGVIGPQHSLQKLTDTLAALGQAQTQQQQRDTQIQQQLTLLTTIAKQLRLAVLGLGILTLVLCGLVGWQVTHRPDMAYARALGALDATLTQ